MSVKILAVVLNLCCFAYLCDGAPYYNLVMIPQRNSLYPYAAQPRPLGSIIGDWISGSNWFPIEINVQDAIGSISGSISNGISGITGAFQRIPFIHRLTSPERPRPMQYFILVPAQPNHNNDNVRYRNDFNPFAPAAEVFPHYP